ncbi:LysM peptidoglycan-binding domain-containing protein [Humidisolicoccus flavus]|uniref:LysM peptidoglycan-binding domain-containing protein n=1 Tax=Humidisolicoccus flavus TaxID=3111414 RepID=UPI00324FC446
MSRTTGSVGHLKITARGRRALALVIAVPVLAVGALLGVQAQSAVATEAGADVAYQSITVMQGQSLWDIANEVAPSANTRDVILEIAQLNDVSGALQPGQSLFIPLEYTK